MLKMECASVAMQHPQKHPIYWSMIKTIIVILSGNHKRRKKFKMQLVPV